MLTLMWISLKKIQAANKIQELFDQADRRPSELVFLLSQNKPSCRC